MSSRFLAAGLVVLFVASTVLANGIPFPRPQPPVATADAKLVVLTDANAKKPLLRVPVGLVTAVKKEDPRPPRGQAMLNEPATLIAGLALAGAFVSGGFWLLRGKGGRTAAAIVCVGCLALAGGTAFADLLPPRPAPPLPAVNLPGKVMLSSDVTIVVVNTPGNTIELVLPPEKTEQKPELRPEPEVKPNVGSKPPEKPE
jgi:hypothetical protein